MCRQSAGAVRADAARLQYHLERCPPGGCASRLSPDPAAEYIWSYGADFGAFSGVAVDAYCKDLPIARVAADVLIAYEMNGVELPAEHGFPPGCWFPGSTGPTASSGSPASALPNGGHRVRSPRVVQRSGAGCSRQRDWRDHTGLVDRAGVDHRLAGTARDDRGGRRAGNLGLGLGGRRRARRRYSRRGERRGAQPTRTPRGREWQRFSMRWSPQRRGTVVLASCAMTKGGLRQPETDRRNAVQAVLVNVV